MVARTFFQAPAGGGLLLADEATDPEVPDDTGGVYYVEGGIAKFRALGGSPVALATTDDLPDVPVTSVAGRTGAVTLARADVGLSNVDNTSDAGKPISTATQAALNAKLNSTDVPVTSVADRTGAVTLAKADVGLSNVDNTSDASKPISTATQAALNAKESTITGGTTGQFWRGDKTWQTLDKTAVGLPNVDNTSDANKPVSTATQTALNGKEASLGTGTTAQFLRGDKTWATPSGSSTVPGRLDLQATTTDATAKILTTDGGAVNTSTPNVLVVADPRAVAFRLTVVARATTVGNASAASWTFEGLIRRNSGNAAMVGPTSSTLAGGASATAWTVTVAVDTTTTNYLKITATGTAALNVTWYARIEYVDI